MEQTKSNTFRLGSLVNGRLKSLSLPRDLTLGGNKNKKTYAPNLNVVRNKDKPKEAPKPNIKKNERKPYNRMPKVKQKNQSGRFVQSSGVFSEGAALTKPPAIRSDRYSGARDYEPAAIMEMPAIVKTDWNVDKNSEDAVIRDLLADDEESSSDEDPQYMPVLLPLKENSLGFKRHFKVKSEPKIEIKKEPADDIDIRDLTNNDDSSSGSIKRQTEINSSLKGVDEKNIKKEDQNSLYNQSSVTCLTSIKEEPNFGPEVFNGIKKYNDDDLNFSLIKMPDALPGKGFAEDSEEPTDFTLHHMHEGQIGKILIRKSGKIDVMIGKVSYTLEAEEPPQFIEHAMAVPNDKNSQERTMVHLASITDRFVMSPSWEHLFLQGRIKKKC